MNPNEHLWRADALTMVADVGEGASYQTHEIGGLGSRFMAGLIDFIIKFVPVALAIASVFVFRPRLLEGRAVVWIVLGCAILEVFYPLLFELATGGQTPGKNACGLRVISQTGRAASTGQLLMRNLLRIADWLPFQYAGGAICAFADSANRRLGDRAAQTIVIYDDSLRDLLNAADTPASLYSNADDGYILEAFLMRAEHFSPEILAPLSRRLALYFFKKYPTDDLRLKDDFNRGQSFAYLQELYRSEKETPSSAEQPDPK
jgi:uncharacterized RDD family membrane protein YckC